ncbi:hypothetical protein BDV37DRAFT_170237 [Aspergillus pseudonomiae]|uniref:Uncharacterized protein n=1 Tax=Aspergillus pseudonomiae TaxID=1506151 RepID=A0A5N7D5W2_9EURO|nr:uncharacterized protein BDV37DRAFT_170237 [Aspergillus pseudonomiae]KAE8401795.1 hypothetical protein BDV37DRAFT_170237 [Aspergillus pseudonomiae]
MWQCTRANKINCNRGCHGCHEKPSRMCGLLHVTTLHSARPTAPFFRLLVLLGPIFFPVISQSFIFLLPPLLSVGFY